MSCLLLSFQHYCMGKEIICPANFLRKTAMKEIKIADSTCRWNHLFRTRFCYKLSLQLLSVLLSVVIYFGIFEWLVWIRMTEFLTQHQSLSVLHTKWDVKPFPVTLSISKLAQWKCNDVYFFQENGRFVIILNRK